MCTETTSPGRPVATAGGLTDTLGGLIRRPEAGTFLALTGVYTFFAIMGGAVFVGAPGWSSFLNMVAEVRIIALQIGLLMIAGELDISVGAVLPAALLTVAVISGHYDIATWIGVLAGLSVGLLVGMVNGILVALTTMFGTMGLTLGFTVMIMDSTGVFMTPDPFMKGILGQLVGGSQQIIIFRWVAITIVIGFVRHQTRLRNWIFAMGGDKESARNAGIPVNKVIAAQSPPPAH